MTISKYIERLATHSGTKLSLKKKPHFETHPKTL